MSNNALALPAQELAEYEQMCARLKTLVVGGRKMTDEQVTGLAAFATAEKLDPFNGECYMMVDKDGRTMGPTVGIKGIRRKAQETLPKDDHYTTDFELINPPAGVLFAYTCTIRDSKTTAVWAKQYKEFRGLGMTHAEAIECAGSPPKWTGIGYFYAAEKSDYKDMKFNPIEKAQKRAEAAALRKRFSLPYNFSDNDDAGPVALSSVDVIDGQMTEIKPAPAPETPRLSSAEAAAALGFGPAPKTPPPPEPPADEIIMPEPEPEPEGEPEPAGMTPEQAEVLAQCRAQIIKDKNGDDHALGSLTDVQLRKVIANTTVEQVRFAAQLVLDNLPA